MVIIDQSPINNQTDIGLTDILYVTFDVEPNISYIQSPNVRLKCIDNDQLIAISVTKSDDDPTKIIITPLISLEYERSYRILLKDDILDINGVNLDDNYSITFTTGDAETTYVDVVVTDEDDDGSSTETVIDRELTSVIDDSRSSGSSYSADTTGIFYITGISPVNSYIDISDVIEFEIILTFNKPIIGFDRTSMMTSLIPENETSYTYEIDGNDLKLTYAVSSTLSAKNDIILHMSMMRYVVTADVDSNVVYLDDDYYLYFILNPQRLNLDKIMILQSSIESSYLLFLVAQSLQFLYQITDKSVNNLSDKELYSYLKCAINNTMSSNGDINGVNLKGISLFKLGDLYVEYSDNNGDGITKDVGLDECIALLTLATNDGASLGVKSGRTVNYPSFRRRTLILPQSNIFDDGSL